MSDRTAVPMSMSKPVVTMSWVIQVGIAGLFVALAMQKFSYAPMTQVIFGEIGGRPAATASGVMELVAAVMLLMPRLIPVGAMLAMGSMVGAIGTHLAVIGITLTDPTTGESDGGSLFGMAVGVFIAAAIVLVIRRRSLPIIGSRLAGGEVERSGFEPPTYALRTHRSTN